MDVTNNCHFPHQEGVDYLPLKALHNQLLHLARYLSTYSSVATLLFCETFMSLFDRLCGLVVRVSGYRYRGPGFDPRRYRIF